MDLTVQFKKRKRRQGGAAAAFTIIEVLVAVSILVIIVSLVSSITQNARTTIASSSKRFDADSEARSVLDRMAIDVAKMIKRGDIEYYFSKQTTATGNGNDILGFYSEAQGYGEDNSPYSVVEYKVLMGDDTKIDSFKMPGMILGRSCNGLTWDTGLNFTTTGDFPVALKYQATGAYVFRMEYTFLMKSVNGLTAKYNDNPFQGDPPATHFKEIDSLVVAIAVMGLEGRQKMESGGSGEAAWLSLINSFPDAHGNSDVISRWYPLLNSGQGIGGVSAEVAKNIRVYQRTFPLNGR